MGAAYSQLSIGERKKIERWRQAKVSVEVLSRVLKRRRSTIFREIRRNHFHEADMPKVRGYFAMAAQIRTVDRRARQCKLIRHRQLCARIVAHVTEGWTPEQIAGRLRLEKAHPRLLGDDLPLHLRSRRHEAGAVVVCANPPQVAPPAVIPARQRMNGPRNLRGPCDSE